VPSAGTEQARSLDARRACEARPKVRCPCSCRISLQQPLLLGRGESGSCNAILIVAFCFSNAQGAIFFEDLAGTIYSSLEVSTTEADTQYGKSIEKMKTATAEAAERKMFLGLGLKDALGRIDSLPPLTDSLMQELAQACTKDSFFDGQHVFTQV